MASLHVLKGPNSGAKIALNKPVLILGREAKDCDVVVANQNGPLLVYKNTVKKDRQWIQFALEGTQSNKSAIGAQVLMHDGKQLVSQVTD